jgi:hypothetical protein
MSFLNELHDFDMKKSDSKFIGGAPGKARPMGAAQPNGLA